MPLNVEGYIEEGITSKIQGKEGKEDELGDNRAEMTNKEAGTTKKDEGKKPSTPQKLKRTKRSEGTRKFSTIWDHFTMNSCQKNPNASCNYCGQNKKRIKIKTK